MTFFDAVISNPLFSDIPKEQVALLLTSRGFEGGEAFSPSRTKELELISADLYVLLALGPEYSEGSLSVKYDRQVLLSRAKGIYRKFNDPKLDELQGKPLKLEVGCSTDQRW